MLKQRLFNKHLLPPPLRQKHPLVQQHLRQPALRHFRNLVFGSSIGLFILFGGLSLPMLYLLLSLVIFVQLATGTAERIYRAQEVHTWDLIRVAPFSRREVLLSTWAAGVWQLNKTGSILMYWILHGFVMVGMIIFGLWLEKIPINQATAFLLVGTLLIAFQPFAEMYLSGMVGLLCASLFDERILSLAAAGLVMTCYWICWVAGMVLLTAIDLGRMQPAHIILLLSLPLALPCAAGYCAQRIAERRLAY